MRTPTLAVRVQLPLGWNTYLLSNTDIVNFMWKTIEGEVENIVLLIFVLFSSLVDEGWWSGAEGLILGQLKSYFFFQPVFFTFKGTLMQI